MTSSDHAGPTHVFRTPGCYDISLALTVPGHGTIPLVPAPGGHVLPKLPRKLTKHLRRYHGVTR